ncbi:MAG: class I SAM-dependent methyltransferase [Anaerofustis stercorihominis]|nr:class I SAM-dependent methyltransferase [Anaerofustis stercorihominis]
MPLIRPMIMNNLFNWLDGLDDNPVDLSSFTEAYSDFSDYYADYADEYDYDRWFEFLLSLSDRNIDERSRVLDLGCGTGGMMLKFLSEGAFVVGVDFSRKMLDSADDLIFLSGESERYILLQKDISEFFLSVKFDFVYSMGDTINYLLEESALTGLFCNVRKMMHSDSIFTFDIINKDHFAGNNNSEEIVSISAWRDTHLHFYRNLKNENDKFFLYTKVEIRNEDGTVLGVENHKQRVYTYKDIEMCACMCGFDCHRVPFLNDCESLEKIQIVLKVK